MVSEAGFVPGAMVTLRNRAPGGGPCVFAVDDAAIAIRREVAACIEIGEQS
jgi:Fe2+ transport system protein FeoA